MALATAAAPTHFSGVLKHSSKCPGFFAAVTVVGVADDAPEEVFARFCHPLGHPSVFSSVKAVEELSRREQQGSDGRQLSELEIMQHVEMRLFGKTITTPMRLKLTADHVARQLKFTMLEGNGLMRKIEGVYAVLPLDDSHAQQDLMAVAATLVAGGQPAQGTGNRISSSGGGGRRRRQRARGAGAGCQRSIVVMHQKVKPFMAPPPPFGRLLRGHLAHQFEHMMHELQAACKLSAESRRAAAAAAAATEAAAGPRAMPVPSQQAQQVLQSVGGLLQRPCGWLHRERGWAEWGLQGLAVGGAAAMAVAGVMRVMAAMPRRSEC